MNYYDLIIPAGGQNYHYSQLIKSLALEDNLEEIAYRAYVEIVDAPEVSLAEGQTVAITGPDGQHLLYPGVIWSIDRNISTFKSFMVTIYDRSIYLKSEDEYLFPEGQTAAQRFKQYAKDWNIPLGAVAETNVLLAKAVYRAQPVYSMIFNDLKETVRKGGDMFRPRFTENGLELVKLGSNENIPIFETGKNIANMTESSTMDTVVTQVKILGSAIDDERSPVLAIVKGDIQTYGTLQKIVADKKITTAGEAKTKGSLVLRKLSTAYSVDTLNIDWLRAGDKVKINGTELIVASVSHTCGNPGRMSFKATDPESIKYDVYLDFDRLGGED